MLNKNHLLNWCCCDRKSRAAYAQSFAPWQQATIEITRRDHSIIACSRHTHIFLFFAHIPVVVNHTINATPPEGCNNIPSFLKRTTPIARSLCEGWTPHDLHILVTAPFRWRVSPSVTHKHELWIWFTLSYATMKVLPRLAAVRDTKQARELRGDTVHFIASSSALVLMTQNGNICRPLTQTATFTTI